MSYQKSSQAGHSPILYTSTLSANGRKALAVVYHLDLNIEIQEINVYQGAGQNPEYLAINPFGKIPTLVDGQFVLWESNAILQYLAEAYGDYQLYSTEPKMRADIARWLFWESAHWQPAISAVLSEIVGHQLLPNIIPAPAHSPNWEEPKLNSLTNYLNSHLGHQAFLTGNKLTIADLSVAGMMTYFRFAKCPFSRLPNLSKWYEEIEALDAWRRSEADLWKV